MLHVGNSATVNTESTPLRFDKKRASLSLTPSSLTTTATTAATAAPTPATTSMMMSPVSDSNQHQRQHQRQLASSSSTLAEIKREQPQSSTARISL